MVHQPMTSLTFLGGARTVTGSRFLLEAGDRRVLVDCGIFQGLKDLRLRNWAEFPVDPASIDAVVITHAHLDHCGYLPRLARLGFEGPVYVTPDTAALMGVVLPDSGRLHEEEAEFLNRTGATKHHPALPLYTERDAFDSLHLLEPVEFHTPFPVADTFGMRFDVAGHILGSATVRAELPDGVVVRFSGDLGRSIHPLLRPVDPVGDADYVVAESTYGDREHVDEESADRLAALIERTVHRRGTVVIPAFAVDRTEVILYHLARLWRAGRLPDVPVFVDSPMALAGLRIYRRSIDEGRADVRPELTGDEDLFDVPQLRENETAEGSMRISARREPAVVIAGAGMATGGRVVHHLKAFLPHARNTVVLVGFQAEGTRGRSLRDGAQVLKMHGRYVPVRAEIEDLSGFSVHADQSELLDWLATAEAAPEAVFVVHGEADAAMTLRSRIDGRFGWTAAVPALGERVLLHRPER